MINCQNITFSESLSHNRITKANTLLGDKVVKRILAFSLYLLGVNRKDISEIVNLPINTVKSNIKAILSDGIVAFEDRRQKKSTFLPIDKKDDISISTIMDNENFTLIVTPNIKIQIPSPNKLQLKTLVLTILNNGLMKTEQAAKILNLSTVHTNNLAKEIESTDINCLLDKRKGQSKEYIFNPEIKAELIQQYTLACICKQKTSGKALSQQLKERCQLDLSERSIRYHIEKLGLSHIKKTLPQLFTDLKKNS